MIFGGLLAGGTGSRMETAVMPKQFIPVGGVPIFIRSLQKFLQLKEVDKVIVSTNIAWESKYRELLSQYKIDEQRVVLTKGGDSRFNSLVNIAKKAKELTSDTDSILISHDCARIFVSDRILRDNIALIDQYEMVTTSIPTIDTILESEDGKCSTVVPDRKKLWCDQGPQTFRVDKFLKYVAMIPQNDISSYIEAGKVYLSHGEKIGIVRGERFNFKVTNDIDLKYAEFLLQEGFVK